MPLPDLCLLPHEVGGLATGESLCAPADARVRVESGPRAGDYLVRTVKTPRSGKILAARREALPSPLLYVHHGGTLGDDTAGKIEREMFNRLLYFDSNCRLMTELGNYDYHLIIHAGDKGDVNWRSRGSDEVNLRCFDRNPRWRCPLDWKFDTPDEGIERDINRMLRDDDSYFAVAHGWKMLDAQQQGRRLVRFVNGDWDEFTRCLYNLVLSFDDHDPDVEWELTIRVHKRSNFASETEFFAMLLMETHLLAGAKYHRLSGIQSQIFEALLRYFYPLWDEELEKLLIHHEIYTGQESNFPIQVIVPVASAHQRLEARLQLRDFLRDKVGAPKLAELMNE